MVSYAVKPIDVDGARIFAYTPGQSTPWRLVFDWDRGGTPHGTHEVGGQGLTRIRSIDGRLYATDSDAPLYGGFGLTDAPFEDYVFVSDRNGRFPPLQKDDAPPTTTRIAPLAFHIFDIVRYRGALVASGGTIAVHDRSGTRFPGGVFVGPLDRGRLEPRWTPGAGKRVGVVRTTYMHRFGGRLYMGFQNNERRARWDLAVLSGDPLARATAAPTLLRVTKRGGWLTRRFASTRDRLYWIASGYPRDGRPATLFVSTDGASFRRVPLPSGAGAPQDMQVIGNTRYLLTARALYRAGPDDRFVELAAAPKGAFDKFNTFCSAPLSVLGDHLYAGSTRDGALYRIVPQ